MWCAKVTTKATYTDNTGDRITDASGVVAGEVKLDQGFVTVRMQIPEVTVTQAHHPLPLLWLSSPGRHGYDYWWPVVFSARRTVRKK
jgi:hypothetical protein